MGRCPDAILRFQYEQPNLDASSTRHAQDGANRLEQNTPIPECEGQV